ncbi:hypothetical protein H6F76_12610 [Leptolyngbya sp. FACHB-321]|uniref:hypothetical protein n=1 Tax=Leptolyngbya sp. FACHB-321 TaxID=2692807 RepID=UPI001684004C|nr:hypothetical protein [Leptolyngbya sp. FACHB-321]MBD2035860.1 hypothetical protein [Leptolyngbya sp. FACHB-321]
MDGFPFLLLPSSERLRVSARGRQERLPSGTPKRSMGLVRVSVSKEDTHTLRLADSDASRYITIAYGTLT